MRKRSQASRLRKKQQHLPLCPLPDHPHRWFHLCSLFCVASIAFLFLNSIIIHGDGQQEPDIENEKDPSFQLHPHAEFVPSLDTNVEPQETERSAAYEATSQNQCSSSPVHFFMNLLFPVCDPAQLLPGFIQRAGHDEEMQLGYLDIENDSIDTSTVVDKSNTTHCVEKQSGHEKEQEHRSYAPIHETAISQAEPSLSDELGSHTATSQAEPSLSDEHGSHTATSQAEPSLSDEHGSHTATSQAEPSLSDEHGSHTATSQAEPSLSDEHGSHTTTSQAEPSLSDEHGSHTATSQAEPGLSDEHGSHTSTNVNAIIQAEPNNETSIREAEPDEHVYSPKNYTQNVTLYQPYKISYRQDPGGKPYNYASESKGAKVLASNKDTKGASNILNKDKDKYLRNPCSVQNKYVDIELSEKTLAVALVIANYEFYSSNPKEFELLGSLVYPTADWVPLGKYQAENTRASQNFNISEPKWVKYLRLQMLSHYGSEFYCTLSLVEVYGVDAIELLLHDWIAEESGDLKGHSHVVEEVVPRSKTGLSSQSPKDDNSMPDGTVGDIPVNEDSFQGEMLEGSELKGKSDDRVLKDEVGKGSNVEKQQPIQSVQPGLDSVMMILMQKVKSIEHDQPLIRQYVEEQNQRNKELFTRFDRDLIAITEKLKDAQALITELTVQLHTVETHRQQDKIDLEFDLTDQLKKMNADFELLRSHITKMESKETIALLLATLCIIWVAIIHALVQCTYLFRTYKMDIIRSACGFVSWCLPFLSCGFIVLVLSF